MPAVSLLSQLVVFAVIECVHSVCSCVASYTYSAVWFPCSPGCYRLRDLSAQDKQEHHRAMKDLDKSATELNQLREQKEKLTQELQVWMNDLLE